MRILKPLKFRKTSHLKGRQLVINIILDGVAISPYPVGDAFKAARKPIFDRIYQKYLHRQLFAHGTYVGLPSNDEMGNSEVGHNAIGSGKIYPQGAKLVNQSLENKSLFTSKLWKRLINEVKKNNSHLHFLGLLSDGYVHSHINHLKALSEQAAKEEIKTIRLHAILDGRDTPPDSSIKYINEIEDFFKKINQQYKCDAAIATVGGRMLVFMDRYEADWKMVEKGWRLMVEGVEEECNRRYPDALTGISALKKEGFNNDQYTPPFLIDKIGNRGIKDGDVVILFNYRGDRAIEISRAFDDPQLPHIKKKYHPQALFAGIMLYDGDLGIPKNYLVSPPHIQRTMGEYLVKSGHHIFAISETQKYGHVSYFWNGNRSGKFSEDLEDYIEIKSDNVPFDERPWMKAAEITDAAIKKITSGNYSFGRINYPNGDMVGHTGNYEAARISVEATDLSLGRLLKIVKKHNGIAIITADHGNCDEMYQLEKTGNPKKTSNGDFIPKTSHSLNPVPFIIYDPLYGTDGIYYRLANNPQASIANLAATTFNLMNYEAPEDYMSSLIEF